MRIQFGGWAVIRTAKSLRAKIDAGVKDSADKTQPELLHHLLCVYSTRILGLVFYRNDFGKYFKTTSIRDMVNAEKEEAKLDWLQERSEICGRNLQLQEHLETLRQINANLQQKLKAEQDSSHKSAHSFFEIIKVFMADVASLKAKLQKYERQ